MDDISVSYQRQKHLHDGARFVLWEQSWQRISVASWALFSDAVALAPGNVYLNHDGVLEGGVVNFV